jgi:hypothetical protein
LTTVCYKYFIKKLRGEDGHVGSLEMEYDQT